jgi:hypothetical protein
MRKALMTGLVAILATLGLVGVASPAMAAGPYYFYNSAFQTVNSDGALVNITIEKPYLDTARDYHSLAELVVVKTISGQRNIVEMGWNVDPTVNGDTQSHLFIAWWKNGVFQCYNAVCPGFIDFTPTNTADNPGVSLTAAPNSIPLHTSKQFAIQHANGAWWFGFNSQWIGYINDTSWGNGFTSGDGIQAFTELAAGTLTPCSDMGNGKLGDQTANLSGRIGSLQLFGTTTPPAWTTPVTTPSSASPNEYKADMISSLTVRTFWVGGPGYNAAGTGAGTTGAC